MYERAYLLSKAALPLFREIRDRCGEALACDKVGSYAAMLGRFAEADESFELAVTTAREIGDEFISTAAIQRRASMFYNPLGMFEEALVVLRAIDGAVKRPACLTVFVALNLSEAASGLGRFAEAKEAAERALCLGRGRGNRLVACRASLRLGEAELGLDHCDAARAALELALARELGFPAELAFVLHVLARACRLEGDLAAAKDALAQSLAIEVPYDVVHRFESGLWTGACIFNDLGEHQRAELLACRARGLVEERSAAIPDERWPASYRAISYNRGILSARTNARRACPPSYNSPSERARG